MENKKNENEISKDIEPVSGGNGNENLSESSRNRDRFGIPAGATAFGYMGIASDNPHRFGKLGKTTKDCSAQQKELLKQCEYCVMVMQNVKEFLDK